MDSEAGRVLVEQTKFLLDRLNDFDDWSRNPDELLRDWCGHVDPARSRLASTVARFELDLAPDNGLREALEPFAMALAEWGDEADQTDHRNVWEHPIAQCVTIGDFRRAAKALADIGITISPTQPNTGERDDG